MSKDGENKVPSPVAVTGASGYIASWLVKELLELGATVHATVRDASRADKVGHLDKLAAESPGTLRLFEADLLEEGSFDAAFEGCRGVFHTASPFFFQGVKDAQRQLVDPALKGTRNVLGAVNRTPSVQRVVLTTSVAAVYGQSSDTLAEVRDESHWNETSSLTDNPYSYSKTVAEKAAWEMARAQERWDLVAINLAFVMGPSVSERVDGTSVKTILGMLTGEFRFGVPALDFGVVDVRDVAHAHVLAMRNPEAEGRHLVFNEVLPMLRMAEHLRAVSGGRYPKLPRGQVPKFMLYLVGPSQGFTWNFVTNNVGVPLRIDNSKSKKALGMEYRSTRDTLADQLAQLEAMKLLR